MEVAISYSPFRGVLLSGCLHGSRKDCSPIIAGKRLVLAVEHDLPFLWMRDGTCLQVVAYDDPGCAAVELPHVDAAVHPAHLVHPQGRLDIGKTAVDQIRDETIDGDGLAPLPVVIAHRRARPVHLDPVARLVDDVVCKVPCPREFFP